MKKKVQVSRIRKSGIFDFFQNALLRKICIASLIVLFILFFSSVRQRQHGTDTSRQITLQYKDVIRIRKEWIARIRQTGSKRAYEEFKKKYRSLGEADQHSLMHVFGELLYVREGMKGIAICDDSFQYGCFHGFLAAAINKEGLSVIPKLTDHCPLDKTPGGNPCYHGLGHGFMVYYGYSNIVRALESCESLGGPRALRQCMKGVYMEYNYRASQDPSMSTAFMRPFDPIHPFAPCDRLPKRFSVYCYGMQSDWWVQVFHKDYAKAGSFCQQISDMKERTSCFNGIGLLIAFDHDRQEETLALCNKISDRDGASVCIRAARYQLCTQHVEQIGITTGPDAPCSQLQVSDE